MLETVGAFICVLALVVLWLMRATKRPSNFPPGPKPLPILGNMHQLPKGHLFPLMEVWARQYGPIIGITVMGKPIILIDGVDNILAGLRTENFQNRPEGFVVRARSFGKSLGIFFSNGEQWASSRKFVVKHLRAYSKNEKENIMADEINQFVDRIQETPCTQGNGKFGMSSVNVIWAVFANKRLDFKNKREQKFLKNLNLMVRQGSSSGGSFLINVLPILRFVSPKFKFTQKVVKEIQQYMKEIIDEHREILDPNNPIDLIDHYLIDMEKRREEPNSYFSEEDLITIGNDLFTAGAETTSNSIDFVLLYMVLYPEVQRKLQEELDRVLGRSRRPRLDDKSELDYTMAVITEVERVNSVAPTNAPRVCMKDTTFQGHSIPQGSLVLMNLRSLGYDPKYWDNPEDFFPERHLGINGKYSKPSHLVTFGLGQRVCVGEVFARNLIFLFTSTFFQRFSISLPEGEPKPSTMPLSGFTSAPQPFNIAIKNRC